MEMTEDVLRHSMGALAASSPLIATDFQRSMQASLDSAASQVEVLSNWISECLGLLGNSDFDEFAQALIELALSNGAADGISGDTWEWNESRGADLFFLITGSRECPVGLGTYLILLQVSVRVFGDEDRFMSVAKSVVNIARSAPAHAQFVLKNTSWQSEMPQRMVDAFDGGRRNHLIISGARFNRELLAAFLESGETLVESSSRPQIAALLSIVKNKAYDSVRKLGAGSVLAQFEDAGYQDLTIGLSRTVRNSWAHRSWRDTGTSVELCDKDGSVKESLEYDALVDRLLAGHETVAGITAGLLCAMATFDIETASMYPAGDVFPPVLMIKALAACSGWPGADVSQLGEDGILISNLPSIDNLSWAPVFALASHVATLAKYLYLSSLDSDSYARISLDHFRIWNEEADEISKRVAFLMLLRNVRIDGVPVCGVDQFRKQLAQIAIGYLDESDVALSFRRLRQLGNAAGDSGDQVLKETIAGVIARRRALLSGLPEDSTSVHSRQRLVAFVSLKVDMPTLKI